MQLTQARLFFGRVVIFREDPDLVPKIIPKRKEGAGYKLADFGLEAKVLLECIED